VPERRFREIPERPLSREGQGWVKIKAGDGFQNGNEASSKSPQSFNRSDSRKVSSCDFYPKKIPAQAQLRRGTFTVQFARQ
jgi:hypothetical protein